jgi:membrane-bound metal-dependent hydrolase YbcI (DUF457 family)
MMIGVMQGMLSFEGPNLVSYHFVERNVDHNLLATAIAEIFVAAYLFLQSLKKAVVVLCVEVGSVRQLALSRQPSPAPA